MNKHWLNKYVVYFLDDDLSVVHVNFSCFFLRNSLVVRAYSLDGFMFYHRKIIVDRPLLTDSDIVRFFFEVCPVVEGYKLLRFDKVGYQKYVAL